MTDWTRVGWPEESLGHAVLALARAAGLDPLPLASAGPSAAWGADARGVASWFSAAAERAGIDIEPVECTYAELPASLAACGPALVRVRHEHGFAYLAVLRGSRRSLSVLTPALGRVRLSLGAVVACLTDAVAREPRERVGQWLRGTAISRPRADRAARALVEQLLAEHRIGSIWLLRADPGAPFADQLRARRVGPRLAAFVAAALAQVALATCGWWLLARGALAGVVERDWLLAWALAGLSAMPVAAFTAACGGQLLVDVAALIKQRLLCGALRMSPDSIRERGSGRLLALVSESEAIEGPGLVGAFGAGLALVQLIAAGLVLSWGAGGALQVALLAAWTLLSARLGLRFYRRRAAWTARRTTLASSFVENVLGQRTRVSQQPQARWHELEDALLQSFAAESRAMDAAHRWLGVLPARGWMLIGLLGLVPALLAPSTTPAALAVAIGGILQGYAAFAGLSASASMLCSAWISLRHIAELFHAAAHRPSAARTDPSCDAGAPSRALEPGDVLLDVRALSYRYPHALQPVLRQCALTLRAGDRVLLEGASGGGKSTLAALLLGLRNAESGLILSRGLDRPTLGSRAWRQRIASAPQFHENHLLSASLAFNLLMGRSWPPTAEDRREAQQVCQQLGLGPTLARMPAGLDQVVGETGWQLSHGERSRVFLARALLQRADVVVLDETFGALDPHTVRACVDTVVARAPALLVIAHP